MVRKKLTAAEYIERHDGEMRIILGELVEYAGKINLWWTAARNQARERPEDALTNLIDAEIYLDNHVRVELSDSLRRIRAAISRLDGELPDHDSSDSPSSGDISAR
jgi:hypothetical protein